MIGPGEYGFTQMPKIADAMQCHDLPRFVAGEAKPGATSSDLPFSWHTLDTSPGARK
jgi:hypothetical protein